MFRITFSFSSREVSISFRTISDANVFVARYWETNGRHQKFESLVALDIKYLLETDLLLKVTLSNHYSPKYSIELLHGDFECITLDEVIQQISSNDNPITKWYSQPAGAALKQFTLMLKVLKPVNYALLHKPTLADKRPHYRKIGKTAKQKW